MRTELPPVGEPAVQITGLEVLDTKWTDPLLWFGIDEPSTSSRLVGYDFIVSGWVVHPELPAESVQVISSDGTVSGWGRVALARPDLGKSLPNLPRARTCGFRFAAGAMALTRDFECTIAATLEDGRRVSLGRVQGRRPTLPPGDSSDLQPILVTSLGRSGSTALLGMLAAHPAIVADRVAPYETRTSTYWLHVFHVLSRSANHAHEGDLATLLTDPQLGGQSPLNVARRDEAAPMHTWYARTQIERLAVFCRANVESFYRAVAEANGQQQPKYFAEKRLNSVLANPLVDLYPSGREIFLVRDFRDVAASIFGRQLFASDEEYLRRLAVWARQLHEAWRHRALSTLMVRYEDLVLAPGETLAAILEYLQLEPDDRVIEATISGALSAPELPGHRTAADAASSIGRWRLDLDDRLKEVCAEEFGALLSEFGYATPAY
jgi:Sulfotransferase family